MLWADDAEAPPTLPFATLEEDFAGAMVAAGGRWEMTCTGGCVGLGWRL